MSSLEPLLISTDRAAETIGCRKTKLFELIAKQAIETVMLGRRRMIVASSLNDFVERLREQARSEAA